MNPASSAQPYRPASSQPSSSSTAAARPNAGEGARQQRFIDDINEAIGKYAILKEQDPWQGLQNEELTALCRERDRLAPMCTDDAGAIELAPHLSERVTSILTTAVHGVGLAVANHQAQQVPSVSFHVHSLEMKGPPSADEDAVVGPEAGYLPRVPGNQFAGDTASMNPQQHLTAIGDLLDQQCKQAITEGKDSYRTATHARDAVMEAVLDGATTVMVDLPATLVTQLAQLGLTCRPKAQVRPVQQRVAESKDGPEQIQDSWEGGYSGRRDQLRAALKRGDSAEVTALMGSLKGAGLNPQQIGELLAAKNSSGRPGFCRALANGHATAVTAFMDGLKGAGLSPNQIGELLAAKDSDEVSGLHLALQEGHADAVTAFIAGLNGAGLSSHQIGELLAAKDSDGVSGLQMALQEGLANAVTAFIAGLNGAGLSPHQIGELLAAKRADGVSGLHLALHEGHADAVTAFIAGLNGAGLSPYQIGELLAAKDSDGVPGLQMALHEGHADAVTAFIAGLNGAGLSPYQIGELLAAKRSSGTSGLFVALRQGNATAVTAFMGGLKDTRLSPQQIAEIVVAQNSRGRHGLYYAKRDGHADAEAAYMNGLRDLQQHNLITAQQIDAIVSASKVD